MIEVWCAHIWGEEPRKSAAREREIETHVHNHK